MKIYTACLYGKKEEARRVAGLLRDMGHEVTSRWLDGMAATSDKDHRANALMDLADIDAAEVVVLFSLPVGTPYMGGGRYVEFGYALAKYKRIVVFGEIGENVFHYLPGIESVLTVRALHALLSKESSSDLKYKKKYLEDERAKLAAENEAATGWGAAVGTRSERIQEIDRELSRMEAAR